MERAKRILSFVMLTVFLSAYLASSLHVHPEIPEGPQCQQCTHHIPHAGHIGIGDGSLSCCVLCHFLGLPFVLPLTVGTPSLDRQSGTLCEIPQKPFVAAHLRLAPSRAPPVLSLA